jgi:hypothetical protein
MTSPSEIWSKAHSDFGLMVSDMADLSLLVFGFRENTRLACRIFDRNSDPVQPGPSLNRCIFRSENCTE